MSKIGTQNTTGAVFKPTITTATYDELYNMMEANISLNVTNGLIFSVPQDNGKDNVGAGSIWMTDSEGYLYPITKPINAK